MKNADLLIIFLLNCRMKWIALLLQFFSFNLLHSQTIVNGKVIILHPSVGNSIDLKEKKEFSLFPEYSNFEFESAQLIKHNDTTYTFLIFTTKGKSFERATNLREMQQYYNAIENIKPAPVANANESDDYYTQKPEKDEEAKPRHRNPALAFEIIFDVLLIALRVLAH